LYCDLNRVKTRALQLLSSCPSCLDHGDTCTLILLGAKETTERETDSRRLDSDCRTAPICDGHHGHMRTRVRAFQHFMESLWSRFSNGSGLMSISASSRPQSSIYCRHLFCSHCCVVLFWPNEPCIKSGPIGMPPRVGAQPQHPYGHPPTFLYPLAAIRNTWVLFRSSLAFTTCLWARVLDQPPVLLSLEPHINGDWVWNFIYI
jgi:hypothetical protein